MIHEGNLLDLTFIELCHDLGYLQMGIRVSFMGFCKVSLEVSQDAIFYTLDTLYGDTPTRLRDLMELRWLVCSWSLDS